DGEFRFHLLQRQGQGQPCAGRHGRGRSACGLCPARQLRLVIHHGRCECGGRIPHQIARARSRQRGSMSIAAETRDQVAAIGEKYKYGFVTDIEMERAPKGLSEDTVRFISAKKGEPAWMLDWRLEAYRRWLALEEPIWARVDFPRIDYQDSYYYAAPKEKTGPA